MNNLDSHLTIDSLLEILHRYKVEHGGHAEIRVFIADHNKTRPILERNIAFYPNGTGWTHYDGPYIELAVSTDEDEQWTDN